MTIIDLNRAQIDANSDMVGTVTDNGALGATLHLSNPTNSNSSSGVNIELPYELPRNHQPFDIAFKRYHNGTWYDDDATDARLALYFFPTQQPGDPVYNSSAWYYYRPGFNTATALTLNFRAATGRDFLFQNDGDINQVATPTCDLLGTVVTRIRISNRKGKMFFQVFTGDTLTVECLSTLDYVDGLIVAHYHNYNNVAVEEFREFTVALADQPDYAALLLNQYPKALYTCQNDTAALLDSSGNAYHATVDTTPSICLLNNDTDPAGGSAHEVLSVNANGSFAMEVESYEQDLALWEDLTFSVLFKLNTLPIGSIYCITMAGDGESTLTNILYTLWFQLDNDHVKPYWFQESDAGTNESMTFPGVKLYPDQWAHIAARRDAATKEISLFINGVRSTKTYTNTLSDPGVGGVQHLTIGGTLSGGNVCGHFSFSHFAIYDYPLTDQQLYEQYKAGMAITPQNTYEALVTAQAPNHLWKLTEVAAATGADDAIDGAPIDLTTNAGMIVFEGTTSPLYEAAPQFVATSHDVSIGPWPLISASPAGDIVREGDVSVAFLYRQDLGTSPTDENSFVFSLASEGELETDNHILTFWPQLTGAAAGTRLPYILMEHTTGSNIAFVGATPLPIGQWLHIAIVVNIDAMQCTLYVDGQPEQFTLTNAPSIGGSGNTQQLIFGGNNTLVTSPNNTAAMSLSWFGWWNRVLSQFELLEQIEAIQALLDTATTLRSKLIEHGAIGYWPLNDTDSTVRDALGGLSTARHTYVVADDDGPSSGAPETVGRSQLVTTSVAGGPWYLQDSLKMPVGYRTLGAIGGDFTVGFWLKTTNVATSTWFQDYWYTDKTLLELRQEATSSVEVPFNLGRVGNKLSFAMASSHVSGTGYRFSADTLPDINDGEWHFLVAVRSGGYVTLYVDNAAETQAVNNVECSVGSTISNFTVGSRTINAGGGESYHGGRFAGLFVIPSALDATQVEELRTLSLAPTFPAIADLQLSGTVQFDGLPYEALVRLYESITGELRGEQTSRASDGYYQFTSSDDPPTVVEGEDYFVLCHYGEGIRPLAHGPISPEVYVPPEPPVQAYVELVSSHPALTGLWMLDEGLDATELAPTVGTDVFTLAGTPTTSAGVEGDPILPGTTIARNFDGTNYRGHLQTPSFTWSNMKALEFWFRNNDDFPARQFMGLFDSYTSNSDRGGVNRGGNSPYSMPYVWCSGDGIYAVDQSPITDTNPHHLVAQYNGVTTEVWLDGAKQADALTADLFAYGGEWLAVGVYRYNNSYGDQSYGGSLAGLAIYDSPLSVEDILSHYRVGHDIEQTYEAVVLADGPVEYFNFNENTGTDLANLGSGSATAVLSGSATLENPPLVGEGNSINFTGGKATLTGSATVSTDYTIEAWINPVALATSYQCIMSMAGAGLYLSTNKLNFFYSGNSHQSDDPVVVGTRQHVALVVTNGSGVFYKDGVQIGTCSGCPATFEPVNIGDVSGSHVFTGLMDQIALYDKALSITEVKRHYQAGRVMQWTPKNLLDGAPAFWLDADDASLATLDFTRVTKALSKTGDGKSASQSNISYKPTITFETSLNNRRVFYFDGANQYLAGPGVVGATDIAVFSVSKARNTAQDRHWIASEWNTGGSPGTNEWILSHGSSSTSRPRFVVESGSAAYPATHDTILVDQYLILGGVHDGSNVTLLVDGALEATTTAAVTKNEVAERQLVIGGLDSAANSYFSSPLNIAEVIVLGYTPTTEERQRIEGYLAHKWNLTSRLPVDHPYKTTPPVV